MKKTYLPPVAEILFLQTENLMALSNAILFITPSGEPSVQDADNLLDPGSTTITW